MACSDPNISDPRADRGLVMVSVLKNGHRFLVANTHLESPAGLQHKKEHAELRELQLKQVKGKESTFCKFAVLAGWLAAMLLKPLPSLFFHQQQQADQASL